MVDAIVMDGRRYSFEQVKSLPIETKPESLAMRSNDQTLLFYGCASPLSNFFPAKIDLAEKSFKCMEQFFQYSKCVFAGDMSSAAKVLEVEDPVQQKRLGDRVKGLDEDKWQGIVHEVMFKANMAKFTQYSELGDFLKSTRPKTLAEANPHDLFWGTGVHIHRRDAFEG